MGNVCSQAFFGQFCDYPCDDPFQQAIKQNLPPPRSNPPPDPDAPIFGQAPALRKRVDHTGEDVLAPPYAIDNRVPTGALSDKTAYVRLFRDRSHYNSS